MLKNLATNLDFKASIFDDPINLAPQIKLREKSKKCEIDAVMLYNNIFCLVGINKGISKDVNKEIEKYFEKLDKIEKVSDKQLDLEIISKNEERITSKIELAKELLEEIEKHEKSFSQDYDFILRKVFFCPNIQIEEEIIEKERRENKIIIDKDIFEYFQEVLNRLDKRFLFNDFMHFLDIRKVDLEKRGTSRTDKPAKSRPHKVTKMELEKDKIIMYSLCPRVEDIRDWVTVLRMARKYDKKGFQRMVKSTRLNKINQQYLNKNQTFPNNIIIALNTEIYKKESDFYNSDNGGEVTFFDEYNSLILIDGQHRYFSFVRGNKLDRFILVTLIFFKNVNVDDLIMEKLFYKINKTQERIDPNLSLILEAKIDPTSQANFWYNVFKMLDKKGFFAERFSFKETTMRKGEQKKSIVSVITYGGVLGLNKKYKRKGIEIDGLEIFYTENKQNNIIFAFNLLKNYFDIIELIMHSQGVLKSTLTPREIGALIRLVKHFMVSNRKGLKFLGENKDITKSRSEDSKKVVTYFENILKKIPFKQTIDLDYPASNWAAVEGYMLRKINDKQPTFGNKGLLSKKGLEVYIK